MKLAELIEAMGPLTPQAQARSLLEHPEASEEHLLAVLRKRDLASAVIETIARDERWIGRYKVKAAIVNHSKTPKTLALRLLGLLLWKELLRVAGNFQLPMSIRAAAEKLLRDRLSDLELGEKISLARSATPALIQVLIREEDPRILEALLVNARLRERDVLELVEDANHSREVLRVVADSDRWASHYPVKLSLLKNPRTPVHAALRLLASLPGRAVAQLVARDELPTVVRRGAERMLAGEKLGRRGFR